ALFALVNRGDAARAGEQLRVKATPSAQYYDLWNGARLDPRVEDGAAVLRFRFDGHGFGASFAGDPSALPVHLDGFLARISAAATAPVRDAGAGVAFLPQEMTSIERTAPPARTPPGMVLIPGAAFDFRVEGVEIEGGDRVGVDVAYPWESAPGRRHRKT